MICIKLLSAGLGDACGGIIFNAGPPEGVYPFPKGEILGDLGIAKNEAVSKSSANPVSRVLQADPNMDVHDNFVSIHQELLGLAGSFGPGPASFCDVLLHFRDTTISASGWEALRFNAHNLRIKILRDGLHVIAIDCSEELL